MSRKRDASSLLMTCTIATGNKYGSGLFLNNDAFEEALFDVEDIIHGQPGDPGREWPLPERVKRVVETLLAQRSKRFQ